MLPCSPSPQGISRLLKQAGFERSNHGKRGVAYDEVTTGFVCWKTHHRNHPEQPYVAVQHDVSGMFGAFIDKDDDDGVWAGYLAEMRAWLEDYATVIRAKGWPVLIRDRGLEPPWLTILTVTGGAEVALEVDGQGCGDG